MNCRGLPDKRRDESLANKENQTERNPAADFHIFLRNTLCAMPATSQPEGAKLHNNPKERIWKNI